MPNIDTDLFQVLTLALLFLSLLSLLAALSVLSGIKKRLDSGDTGASAPSAQPMSSYDYQAPPLTQEPAYTAPTSTFAAPAPVQAQEVSTGFVSMDEATATAQPASAALRGDEPEEQPFERDGRWWFKRGGELLVYDEGTGQWVAAPAASGGASASTSATAVQAPEAVRADTGEGWKCASCGAVNGSTATTCRMCFAPR